MSDVIVGKPCARAPPGWTFTASGDMRLRVRLVLAAAQGRQSLVVALGAWWLLHTQVRNQAHWHAESVARVAASRGFDMILEGGTARAT